MLRHQLWLLKFASFLSHLTPLSWHSKSVIEYSAVWYEAAKAHLLQKEINSNTPKAAGQSVIWQCIYFSEKWLSGDFQQRGNKEQESEECRQKMETKLKWTKPNKLNQNAPEWSNVTILSGGFVKKKPSVVHLERMHTKCVKNQSHWPVFEISAAGSRKTHHTKHGHSSNSPCVRFSLWFSVSWKNLLESHLRSLEDCFPSVSLFFLLFLFDKPGKSHGVGGTYDIQKNKEQKTRAGVGGMAVAIKSIKESSKIKLGCYRTNKQSKKAKKKWTNRHIKIESPKLPQLMMQIKNRLGYPYIMLNICLLQHHIKLDSWLYFHQIWRILWGWSN